MNAPTLILLLTNTSLSAYQADRHGAQKLLDIAEETQALDTLRTLARNTQHANFHILTDLAEEDFQYESVPHLSGADQKALFHRKLEQTYRTTPYRRVVVQEKGKRGQQDKIMLSALTVRTRLDAIVTLLLEEKCALLGIHSVALATSELMRPLALQLDHLLLISRTEEGSLRQSYFNKEDLRFSRLGNGHNLADAQSTAEEIAEETRRARQYLTTLRLMNRDEKLDAVLLTREGESSELDNAFITALQADQAQIRASTETVANMAKRLRLPASCADWKTLLLVAIARGKISNHYRGEDAGRYHLLRQLGTGITLGAALLALGGSFMAWQGYNEAARIQVQIDQGSRQLRREVERKKSLETQIKAITQDQPLLMKEAVSLYNSYLAHWPDAEPSAQAISQILSDFPLLEVNRLNWHAERSGAELTGNEETMPADVETDDGTGQPTAHGRDWQIIELDGQMLPFQENYRDALRQMDQLMARISQLPRTQVKMLTAPLDIRPEGNIDHPSNSNEAPKAPFNLRIVIAPTSDKGGQP